MAPRQLTQDLNPAAWGELALLPTRLAIDGAAAFLAMTSAAWLLPCRLGCRWHEPHSQLVVPEPIEEDNEHGLFA